jgi:predicted dehydrogenase
MTINVGIVGFAHGHVNSYCTEWRDNPDHGISVLAGWDHDAGRLEKASQSFRIHRHAEVGDLLSRPDIQAVVIASETSMHADLVERAAAAGKAIILQKPIALTMQEADRIVAAVKRHGVPFTMAWQMRVDPQNIKMKELIESGEFGKIFMVRRRHGLGTHLWPDFAGTWHAQPELNRDIWADDSSHPIDFLQWLLGVPETVTAEIMSLQNPQVPNDNGLAVFRYANGPLAEVCCSFTCAAAENSTEIVAERGTIVQNYGDAPSCNAPRPNDGPGLKWYSTETGKWTNSDIASPSNHGERIRGLAAPLAAFLQGKRGPIATAEEGYTSLQMVLACYVSNDEGKRVSLVDEKINHV